MKNSSLKKNDRIQVVNTHIEILPELEYYQIGGQVEILPKYYQPYGTYGPSGTYGFYGI